MTAIDFDKVLLEILHNRFSGITSEMGHIVHKASFTPFIKESWDFGVGLVSRRGEIFGYPRDIGVSLMMGALMGDVLDAFDDYQPGDIVIANDPYTTGGLCTHLPDFHLFKPYFHDGKLVSFSWAFVHSTDVGGMTPGSVTLDAHDIYQEGLRLPPMKLYRAGKLNEEILDIIKLNCRIPAHNAGDIQALVSAMVTSEKRMADTIGKYGLETVERGIDALLDYGEQRTRAIIERIPDGAYTLSDYMEVKDGGETASRFARINLTLTVAGDGIHLDFTGTDPQVRASLNIPTFGKNHHFINGGIVNYFQSIDPSIPLNCGVLRPISVTLPKASMLNPEAPAAVSARFVTVIRVTELIYGALSRLTSDAGSAGAATLDVLPAAGSGMLGALLLAVNKPGSNELKVDVLQPLWGGSGARPSRDGLDGADLSAGFLRNIPVEAAETAMPVLIEQYKLRTDTPPPAGKWRGGVGLDIKLRMLAPNSLITARGMQRCHTQPWGRKGSEAGRCGNTIVNDGRPDEKVLHRITDSVLLQANETLRLLTPSGGGYGDPLQRDPARVARDAERGLLSPRDAAEQYGVVLQDDGSVDAAATADLRGRRAAEAGAPEEFVFGATRARLDAVMPDACQDALARLLQDLAVVEKQFLRRKAWAWAERHAAREGQPPSVEALSAYVARLIDDPAADQSAEEEALAAAE
ncbi:hydantoinase B/oxoprolinase family protein [Aquibium sp. A9E412]|uniref:hydantoinase B/oxoprolinase family protein n=1 Tax=Aquibium sp. A9E412 TaxID=2976767 RepID=UPI0025B1BCD3|nr:hydantoinase B/oxoprolinase family protein [Aquibium sp. A9E412]MDN2567773.1 hydantoinase B/oxoprolinase family protein [Aquibium sp. A9E412]